MGPLPPPGTPLPPPGGPQQPQKTVITNQKANESVLLGLISFFACGIPGFFSIWLALKAKREIRASGGAQGGDGIATTGLILGIINLLMLVLEVGSVFYYGFPQGQGH